MWIFRETVLLTPMVAQSFGIRIFPSLANSLFCAGWIYVMRLIVPRFYGLIAIPFDLSMELLLHRMVVRSARPTHGNACFATPKPYCNILDQGLRHSGSTLLA